MPSALPYPIASAKSALPWFLVLGALKESCPVLPPWPTRLGARSAFGPKFLGVILVALPQRIVSCPLSCGPVSDRLGRKLSREEERLRSEKSEARVALRSAMAKLERLESQEEMLRRRGEEMLRRGFATLEELEEEDRKEGEQKERERIEKEALQLAAASPSSASDPLDLSWWTGALSPSFGVDPGSGDGTVLPSSNTS